MPWRVVDLDWTAIWDLDYLTTQQIHNSSPALQEVDI